MSAPSQPADPRRSAFPRPLNVDTIPDDGLDTAIEASVAECEAVSAEIGLPAIAALAAHFKFARRPGGRIAVGGTVTAKITQICVVSLDPFESEIAQPIDATFAPIVQPLPDRHGHAANAQSVRARRVAAKEIPPVALPVAGEEDPPDPIVDGRIELGAVAVEFLTLALDFYPRKPGVAFTDVVAGETAERSAFAALARFKDSS